jgi:hypothetical protein
LPRYLPDDWTVAYWDENLLILTPYPGTPLFRQIEREGCLLHRDWSHYDTAHCVFRLRHMSPEALERGYAWCYETLFSHGSIWRRRPREWRAVLPDRAMSYLDKRSNRFWHLLIRSRLTHAVWRPLVEWTRLRHLRFRARLAARHEQESLLEAGSVVSAGVQKSGRPAPRGARLPWGRP